MGGISAVKRAYHNTTVSLKRHPALFLPFLIFAAIETAALIILYLAPRMPLRLAFGPLIKTLWGEAFLHYPANFILLPKLASLSRLGLAIIFSSLLTGMAVAIVYAIHNKKGIGLRQAFRQALKQYASLFVVVLLFSLSYYFSIKLISFLLAKYFMAGHTRLLFIPARLWIGPIMFVVNFIAALFIQGIFVYAIPLLIIGKKKVIPAITGSAALFGKLFFETLILIGLPMLLYVPVIILTDKSSFLISRVAPESVLWICFAGTVISSLVIDPIVTVASTYLYLDTNKNA